MALIKNSDATRLVKSAIVFDLGDVNREAKRLLDDARSEARSIVEQARAEARGEHAAAVSEGHEQGLAAGRREGAEQGRSAGRDEVLEQYRPEVERLIQSWTDALERWEAERRALQSEARQDVLRFAFAFAEKLVHRVIEIDEQVAARQVEAALEMVAAPTALEIAINPEDRATVESVLADLATRIGGCREIAIRDDEQMSRGGCVVATAGGSIDATIETQVARIADALLASSPGRLSADGADR